MSERARFHTTQPAYIHGIGYVPADTVFEAPDPEKYPKFEPPSNCRAMNEAGVEALKAVQAHMRQIRQQAAKRIAEERERRLANEALLAPEPVINLDVYSPEAKPAKPGEAIDLTSPDRLDADRGGKSKRTADK